MHKVKEKIRVSKLLFVLSILFIVSNVFAEGIYSRNKVVVKIERHDGNENYGDLRVLKDGKVSIVKEYYESRWRKGIVYEISLDDQVETFNLPSIYSYKQHEDYACLDGVVVCGTGYSFEFSMDGEKVVGISDDIPFIVSLR